MEPEITTDASILAVTAERRRPGAGKRAGQLAQAEHMLEEAQTQLERHKGLIRERSLERQRIETELRTITLSGDADRIMAFQAKRARFDEDTKGFERRRAELEQSVDNKSRYVETLRLSLETIRKEIAHLEERLQTDGHHAKKIQALEIDLQLARSGKESEESRLAQLRRQIWTLVGEA